MPLKASEQPCCAALFVSFLKAQNNNHTKSLGPKLTVIVIKNKKELMKIIVFLTSVF